jgi:hypothetical protein
MVGHVGAASAEGLRRAGGRITLGLVLHLGVELGAEQHDERRQPEPHQEDEDCAERAVRLVVAAEVLDVDRECERAERPDRGRNGRAPPGSAPARVGPESGTLATRNNTMLQTLSGTRSSGLTGVEADHLDEKRHMFMRFLTRRHDRLISGPAFADCTQEIRASKRW